MRSRRFGIIILAFIILVLVFGAGSYVGYAKRPYIDRITSVINKTPPADSGITADFEPFWKAWNLLETKYVVKDAIDQEALVWGAIQGMARAVGDPYTVFLPPQENEIFEGDIQGEFSGIGAEIGIRDDILVVIAPLKNSPADKAGLKPGDKILKIDDFDTNGVSIEEAVAKIRGPKDTIVRLTVFRESGNAAEELSITRDTIIIPVLDTETKDGVFIIRLYNFSAQSSAKFNDAMEAFSKSGTDKLILDLRNNPGGYLSAAIDMASWFVPEGEVITREEMRDKDPVDYRSRGYAEIQNLKFVVLINQGSASASEILAGALQEHNIAKVMGEKSFGKGSVQELVDVTGNTSLKITVARWLTPKGRSLSENGLDPDIVISRQELEDSIKAGVTDLYMDRAIDYLKK